MMLLQAPSPPTPLPEGEGRERQKMVIHFLILRLEASRG
jgi:hypothetical protein